MQTLMKYFDTLLVVLALLHPLRVLCLLSLSVSLSVRPQDNPKSCRQTLMKFFEGWDVALDFGTDPDHYPDPGIF